MKASSSSSSVAPSSRRPPVASSTEPPWRPAAAPDTALNQTLGRAPALPATQAHAAVVQGAAPPADAPAPRATGPAPRRRLQHPVIVPPDPQRIRKEEEIRANWAPILAAVRSGQLQEAEALGKAIGVHTLPAGSCNVWDYHAVMERQIRRLDTQVQVGDSRPGLRIVGFDVPPPAASGSHAGAADADLPR